VSASEPKHPIATEIQQSLAVLAIAMGHVEEEDPVKAALAIGQAMGRLQALAERVLQRKESAA
jgi:hypothetical protein